VILTRGFVGGMSELLHEMHIQTNVVISTRGFVGGMSESLHESRVCDSMNDTRGFVGGSADLLCKMELNQGCS